MVTKEELIETHNRIADMLRGEFPSNDQKWSYFLFLSHEEATGGIYGGQIEMRDAALIIASLVERYGPEILLAPLAAGTMVKSEDVAKGVADILEEEIIDD